MNCCLYLLFLGIIVLLHLGRATILFGFTSPSAVVISSSGDASVNGVMMRSDYQWVTILGKHICLGLYGDIGDCQSLLSYVVARNNIFKLLYGQDLSCSNVAHFCRHLIAEKLRQSPLQVSGLVAGMFIVSIIN